MPFRQVLYWSGDEYSAAEPNDHRVIHGSEPGAAHLLGPMSFDSLSCPHFGLGLGLGLGLGNTAECHRLKMPRLKRQRPPPPRPTNHWPV
jgi:hypothetical protein